MLVLIMEILIFKDAFKIENSIPSFQDVSTLESYSTNSNYFMIIMIIVGDKFKTIDSRSRHDHKMRHWLKFMVNYVCHPN